MRVLFIGNSHTFFNDMPALFARFCRMFIGNRTEVTMLAYPGRSLEWHFEEYFSVRFALLYGDYDFCVIQQQAHPFPDESETEKAVEKIIGLCRKSGTVPVIFMPWPRKEEPETLWVYENVCGHIAEKHEALLLPAGTLFHKVGLLDPDIELYWEDGAHASPYGDYLIAAALAVLLTGRKDLSLLGSYGLDFQVAFEDDDGMPHALEDKTKIHVSLKEDWVMTIHQAIRDMKL